MPKAGTEDYDKLTAGWSSPGPSWDILGAQTMATKLTLDQMKSFVRKDAVMAEKKTNARTRVATAR